MSAPNSGSRQFTRLRPRLALAGLTASPTSQISTFYHSSSGMYFAARPEFLPKIQNLIKQVRDKIQSARAVGRFVCYLSVPISPLGGGNFDVNNEIARRTARRLAIRFGNKLMVIDSAAYNLKDDANVGRASGGEYMAVWSDVLAGTNGMGTDIDMVYFAGPLDLAHFFRIKGRDNIGKLENWMANREKKNADFRLWVNKDTNRSGFIRYYALRGSAAYSKGAHDEWNIVASINAKRGIGEEIAVYFNGEPIEPGDYEDHTAIGNQVLGT